MKKLSRLNVEQFSDISSLFSLYETFLDLITDKRVKS